jgi:hypothetical protein
MGSPRPIPSTSDGSRRLLKAACLAAVGSEVGAVVDDVFGEDFVESSVVLAVDQPGGFVSGLGQSLNR